MTKCSLFGATGIVLLVISLCSFALTPVPAGASNETFNQVPTNVPFPTSSPLITNHYPTVESVYLSGWACNEGFSLTDVQPHIQVVGSRMFITYPTIQADHFAWATVITPVPDGEVTYRYWADNCLLPVRLGEDPSNGPGAEPPPPNGFPEIVAVYLSGWACGNNRDLGIAQIAPQLQITEGVLVVSYLVNQNDSQFGWGVYVTPLQDHVAFRYWSDECPPVSAPSEK